MKDANERMAIWLVVLLIALICGLGFHHATFFWVSAIALWIFRSNKEDEGG